MTNPTILAAIAFATKPLALASSAVAAGLLLVRGLRGEQVGDRPGCRRCHADLTRREGNHCPKCGLLLLPGDIVPGSRQRRRWSVLLGSLLLMITIIGLALLGYWVV